MKNIETENQYLLLFRDNGWYTHLSVEELEAVMGKFRTWFENLSAKGIVRGGQPLGREGRVISGKGGRSVNDGPFAETKERGWKCGRSRRSARSLPICRRWPPSWWRPDLRDTLSAVKQPEETAPPSRDVPGVVEHLFRH